MIQEYPKIRLSEKQISEICEEVEHQWLYLIMTRAVFTVDFPKQETYKSPSFYNNLGIQLTVTLPKEKTEAFRKGSEGLANWHNQNYVIRLYGLLEKYKILYSGRMAYENKLMILLYELRPKIGAHSSGRKASDRKHLKKATKLINELFDKSIDVNAVENYSLPLDSVLLPMKNMAVQFVRSLT